VAVLSGVRSWLRQICSQRPPAVRQRPDECRPQQQWAARLSPAARTANNSQNRNRAACDLNYALS